MSRLYPAGTRENMISTSVYLPRMNAPNPGIARGIHAGGGMPRVSWHATC